MELDWVRQIREETKGDGRVFFLKQMGDAHPGIPVEIDGEQWLEIP